MPGKRGRTNGFIQPWLHVKSPQKSCNGEQKSLLCQRLPTALASTPSEGIVALFVRIRTALGPVQQETFGSEDVWVREIAWVTVDGPHVPNDRSAGRDVIASIDVVVRWGVRDASEDSDGAPSERFLDDG